jgi:serine/threonine-protein kinase HipA
LIFLGKKLNEKTIATILDQMTKATPKWKELLETSFLSDEMKEKYLELLERRIALFQ